MQDISSHILGTTDERIRLDSREDCQTAALALARQARRSLDIFTLDLDGDLYDTPDFVEAIKQLAIRHRHTQVRFLVQDATRAVKDGHRLIGLFHRLTSSIHVRKPSPEYREYRQAFLVADGTGMLRRPQADRFEGELNFKAPIDAREQLLFFDRVWQDSEPDPYLRRLHI